MTYRIVDLFSGAGGAAVGYHRAGFEVIGVDIEPQPHYPFDFIQGDALEMLGDWLHGTYDWAEVGEIDAIHASPPCQAWSVATAPHRGRGAVYPELIEPTRELLEKTGLPYVIENVPGAPLQDPVWLCGCQFGLTTRLRGQTVGLRRKRGFEATFHIPSAGPHDHSPVSITVTGHDVPSHLRARVGRVPIETRREVMGIDWMNRDELGEALPPAYTEWVGLALRQHLMTTSNLAEAA